MIRLVWSTAAIADVARLHAFLKHKDPDAARRAAGTIRQGVRILTNNPRAGRPIEDLPPDYREWLMRFGSGAYIALYRLIGDDVVILAVRHSREAGFASPIP